MNYKRLFTAGAILIAFAVAILFITTYNNKYLQLSNEQTGQILFRTKISDGESFSVSYIHSVNKSPVTEYYQIQSNDIYLTSMRFSSFGAGMPEQPEERQTMRTENGEIIIDGFSRHMPYLSYSIGRTAEFSLHFRNSTIPLNSLDEPGQPVLFTIKSFLCLLIE